MKKITNLMKRRSNTFFLLSHRHSFINLSFVTFLLITCLFNTSSKASTELGFLEDDYIKDRRKIVTNFDGPVNILSIDGGGIRGIIPAVFLEKLEAEVKCNTKNIFDLTVGTSTGAILSLGLTTEDPEHKSQYRTAKEMIGIYEDLSRVIFPQTSWWQKPLYAIPSTFW